MRSIRVPKNVGPYTCQFFYQKLEGSNAPKWNIAGWLLMWGPGVAGPFASWSILDHYDDETLLRMDDDIIVCTISLSLILLGAC